MPRANRKQLDQLLRILASQLGVPVASSLRDVGALAFDYYGVGGGYKVVKLSEGGGQSAVFGEVRRKASAMASALHFAINVLGAQADGVLGRRSQHVRHNPARRARRNPGYNVTAEAGSAGNGQKRETLAQYAARVGVQLRPYGKSGGHVVVMERDIPLHERAGLYRLSDARVTSSVAGPGFVLRATR